MAIFESGEWALFIAGALSLIVIAVKVGIKLTNREHGLLKRIEQFVIDHLVLLILASMFSLPLLIQGVYSIPLLKPMVSADAVLAFWGVLLGIVAASFSRQKQIQQEREKRLELMSPCIDVNLCRCNDETFNLQISNRKGFSYTVTRLCNLAQAETIDGYCSTEVKLGKADFINFNEKHASSLSQRGVDMSDKAKMLSLELFDPDGNRWHIDFEFSSNLGWRETFRFYVAGPGC